MLTSFFAGLGSKLAERWLALVFSPAFLFWAGGFGAWAFDRGSGWSSIEDWVTTRSDATLVLLGVGALLLVTISGLVVQAFTLPLLRALEGYWPGPLEPLRRRLVARQSRSYQAKRTRFDRLAGKVAARTASPTERRQYAIVDRDLRAFPSEPSPDEPERLMPTRLGNILRAAESRPTDKYGLDAVKCWSRLWLVLPEPVKKEIADARAALDLAATITLWGGLFLVWTWWAWWALPASLAVAAGGYFWLLGRAEVFGELVESAFDLHRRSLYDAVGWPRPANPAEEQDLGRALSEYLWWGSVAETPTFR